MSESPVMIRVDRLTKQFGPTRAVDAVSFEVRKGEVLGFCGPNGAGKSTTMKMLTCYLTPSGGRAEIGGADVYSDPLLVRRKVGYLPEDNPLYRDMVVLDYLEYMAELHELPAKRRRPRIKEVGQTTGVLDVLGKKIGELSRGYRQRVGLTQAMIHDPDVLILDEPTSGLDPNQIVEIRSLIKELGKEKTLIFSTHILSEVQATCSRVLIIADGKLVADGTPEELTARERAKGFHLLLEAGPERGAVRAKLAKLAGVKEIHDEESEKDTLGFLVDAEGSVDLRKELFRLAVAESWGLLELDRREASLEQVFARLTLGGSGKNGRSA